MRSHGLLPLLLAPLLVLLLQVWAAQAFVVPTRSLPHRARSCITRRQLTVGGEDPSALDSLKSVWDVTTGLGALVVGALVAAEVAKDQPTGWVNAQLVEAAPTTLGPQAGRGLFTLCDIPQGTILGNFPGVVSPRATWLQRKDSEEAAILASRYTWTLGNGDILDPTLPNGELPEYLFFLGGLIRKPTLLALVNEPPVGVDVNLSAVVSDTGVAYRAERNIYQGEELFVDYGPTYDRCVPRDGGGGRPLSEPPTLYSHSISPPSHPPTHPPTHTTPQRQDDTIADNTPHQKPTKWRTQKETMSTSLVHERFVFPFLFFIRRHSRRWAPCPSVPAPPPHVPVFVALGSPGPPPGKPGP